MNKALRHKLSTFVAIALLLGNFSVNAQGGIGTPPPNPPSDPGDNIDDEAPVPIDGFIWISLLAGGVYGLKQIRSQKKTNV